MRPVDVQQIGGELALRWDDGRETFVRLDSLRRACPCAGCQGETDVLGHLHKGPDRTLTPASTQLVRWQYVGGYAIQPFWGDGHSSGIFSFDYLQRVAEAV